MRNWPTRRRRAARIELIPMIDVMLFLLVFFVLISSNVLPALGLRVDLPKSAVPDRLTAIRRATLTITAASDLYLDGAPVPPGGLPARLGALQKPGVKLVIIIAADKTAPLQALVGVLDTLKDADVTTASIVTQQK
jgi:biopolymer transport protein ExbD